MARRNTALVQPTSVRDEALGILSRLGVPQSLVQETYANKIYSRDVEGRTLSAIQITTAAAICTVLD